MCLIKVRKEEDEHHEHYRRVRIREHRSSSPVRRVSRPPSIVSVHTQSRIAIPPPPATVISSPGYAVPPPQPTPIFVQPAPSPPPPIQVIHVEPPRRDSSSSEDEYVYERRTRYERDYSPPRRERSRSRRREDDGYYAYQYRNAPPRREPSRSRSRSRVRYYEDDGYSDEGARRTEKIKVKRTSYRD